MKTEMIATNARIVARREIFSGSVYVRNGNIERIDLGRSFIPHAVDFEGDYLLPGLVEAHTDNLEKHLVPRPKVIWPSPLAALMAHDTQVAGAGITTVLDSIFLGADFRGGIRSRLISESIEALRRARELGVTRSEHLLHLRCEVPEENLMEYFEPYADEPALKLVSLNDHTPGQRQWKEIEKFRTHYADRNFSDDEIPGIIAWRKELQQRNALINRRRIVAYCKSIGIPMASHDDTTEEDVMQAVAEGVTISEFPTTMEAARTAHANGLKIVAGAPNVVRGASHSGNISAHDLAENGLLDALSSDYVPSSLLQSAFLLHHGLDFPLHEAVAMVSATPAEMLNLHDRGQILPGRRADLVRVSIRDGLPVVRTVWRQGKRVI